MKYFWGFLLLFCWGLTGSPIFGAETKKESCKVFFVPQFSEFKEISGHDLNFLKKVLARAKKENVKAVIFEMDTPGGDVFVAYRYLSVLAKSSVPTVAYLNPNGISGGAIIALGADKIAINPNGMIGDMMPLQMGAGHVKPITERPEDTPGDKKAPDKKEPKQQATAEKEAPAKKDEPKKEPEPEKKPTLEQLLKQLQDNKKPVASDDKLVDQKFLTVFFKALQVLAEKNDRPPRVIRAMADPYQRLDQKVDGYQHDKVSPLTLSAAEAKRLKVVDYIARDKHDLLSQLNLSDCELVTIEKSGVDQIVSFLTYPAIAGMLLVFGLLGLYVEIKTPGFGVAGVLGLTALTLFFLGHVASGASDWGPMVVFVVGLVLLSLEIFVIPGFGIVGILGILCIIVSFFMAFGWENFETAAYVISSSLVISIAAMVVLAFYLVKPIYNGLALKTEQLSSEGYSSHNENDLKMLIGHSGMAASMLRPSGIAMIDGKRCDVVTQGEFIDPDSEIVVIDVRGGQIIVGKKTNEVS